MKSASVYLLDIDDVPDAQLAVLSGYLSESEMARYQRLARNERKRQFLAGRLLLRYAVAAMLKISVRAISLSERERQAPLLRIDGVTADGITAPPYFSISHSGEWIACACSASLPVGLDIEKFNSKRDLDAIGHHTFQHDDDAWWQQQPDRVAAFYQLWSRKEARFKLTQNYAIAATEHIYQHPHPGMSVVLMSEQALTPAPEFLTMDWRSMQDFFTDADREGKQQ